jgi:transposase
VDAEKLARYARLDPEILRPIAHRTVAAGDTEADSCSRCAGAPANRRSELCPWTGEAMRLPLPASSTLCFAKRCLAMMPSGLAVALSSLLHQIADMTVKIKEYDRVIKELTETEFPETQALIKMYGVPSYRADLRSDARQRTLPAKSRRGLLSRPATEAKSQSGDSDPQLGITEAGNGYVRQLLTECANHVIGPHEKVRPCVGGVSVWMHEAAATREGERLLLLRGSLLFCSIASGSRRRPTYPFMQRQLEIKR